jgi:hypothetical protein
MHNVQGIRTSVDGSEVKNGTGRVLWSVTVSGFAIWQMCGAWRSRETELLSVA